MLCDFAQLGDFVKARPAVYTNLEDVRAVVRSASGKAARYFQGKKGAASAPRQHKCLVCAPLHQYTPLVCGK